MHFFVPLLVLAEPGARDTATLDCALAELAYEFGSARVGNTAALRDGLFASRPTCRTTHLPPPPRVMSSGAASPANADRVVHVSVGAGNDRNAGTSVAPVKTLHRVSGERGERGERGGRPTHPGLRCIAILTSTFMGCLAWRRPAPPVVMDQLPPCGAARCGRTGAPTFTPPAPAATH